MEIRNLSKDLGLKKIGPLRFREDDNLYKKFQKLAKYIYKNGEWNEADKQEAAVRAFRKNVRDVLGTIEKIELSDPNIPKYAQTKGFEGEVYRYDWNRSDGMPMSAYMFIDTDNKSGVKHAKRFRQDIFGKTRRISRHYAYYNEGAIYNLDRIIGFNQLDKALLKEFDARQGQLSFSKDELSTYLEILSDPKYAAKKYSSSFSKESRHFGGRTAFIEDYITRVYDISVQREYERKLTSQFRASPAFTKANINAETREVMDKTPLKKYFGFVELDNDVDLEKFKDFEQEMQRIKEILPEVESTKPDLRLRKLGNYRALGMFIPAFDTIAIDFRSSSTVNGDNYRPINPGISSFVHEYAHFLDRRVPEKNQDLSLAPAFKPILDNYIEQLKVNGIYDVKHGEVDHYYAVPTEVFARSFEVYVHEKGLRSSLMQNGAYSISKEYISFTPEIRKQLTKYFDEVFPNLAQKIALLNEREVNITKEEEKQKEMDNSSKGQVEKLEESVKDEQQVAKKEEVSEKMESHKFARPSMDSFSKEQAEKPEGRRKDEQKRPKNEDEVMTNANQESIAKTSYELKTDTAKEKQVTSKPAKVNAKEINQAKSEKILAVAQHLGIQLLSDKGKYYWEQEPNFVIDPRSNLFTWKEKDIYHGDPVMLVRELKQLSFDEAVRYLNDTQIAKFDIKKVKYRLKEKPEVEKAPNIPTEKKGSMPVQIQTGSVPKRVTKNQIMQARSRNILEVAQNLGINLRQAGQTYIWTEHDSFVVFPKTNTYSWFSKDEVGKNPIDLVQSFNRVDFKTAVAYLNSADLADFDETKLKTEPQKPFKYLLKDSADVSKLKEYFEAERGISQTTVRDFLQSGVIAQANRIHQNQFEPVIVFKHKEADGKLVGASLQGIKEDFDRYPSKGRLKEIITNSKHNWGITYNCGLEPEKNSYNLIFFEAPIDMMSYYELHKDKLVGTRLVAMNGLKENTIGNHLTESIGFNGTLQQLNDAFVENGLTKADVAERFKKQGGSIKLAVDNDDKGQAFIKKMQEKYPVLPFEAETPPMLAGREKTDWNDYLKATKTGKADFKKITRATEAPSVKDKPKETTKEPQLSPEEEPSKSQGFSLETATAKEISNYAMKKIREFSQDPKVWDEYMTMLGQFSEYSPRNVALIYDQDKDAKMVGTYNEWQMRHERYKLTKDDIIFDQELADRYAQKGQALEQKLSIKSGEKGKITLFRVAKEWHIPRTDAQGNVILNAEDKPKYKKYHATQLSDLEKKLLKEEKIKPVTVSKRDREGKLVFQKYKVFDISQTNLKKEAYAKVTPKHQYDYDAESSKLYKISYALKDYAKQNKIDYHIDKRKLTGLAPTTKGKYQNDGKNARVLMNKNLDFQESLGTAIRLMSHAVVDNKYQEKIEKFQRGLEAEIIGHAVAAHFGLPTEKRYLKEMSEKLQKLSDKELTASLNRAFTSSNEFIKQIARYSETPKRERDRRVTKKKHTPQKRVI